MRRGATSGKRHNAPTWQRDAGQLTLRAVEGERRLRRDTGEERGDRTAGNSRLDSICRDLSRALGVAGDVVFVAPLRFDVSPPPPPSSSSPMCWSSTT